MSDSFLGAIGQFWTIDEKPRLHRKNSWFDDHQISSKRANRFWIISSISAIAIITMVCLGGIL